MRHLVNRRPLAAAVAACLLAAAAYAAQPGPYVLTQAFCISLPADSVEPVTRADCDPQVVPVGAIVQIQLPGTPSGWRVAGAPVILVGTDSTVRIPSPGRIDGAGEIWVFTFRAERAGEGVVTLGESPRHLTPAGEFRFPVVVR